MTLKHINFYESPVMRELARQAIKRGSVTPLPPQPKKKVTATGELLVDLVTLANELRTRGYVDDARSLEQKILNYKLAGQKYLPELDLAHADGSVEMAPASNGLGVVETLEDQHEKILEVVNKSQQAKRAEVVQFILEAAEEILFKTAQDGSLPQKLEVDLTRPADQLNKNEQFVNEINQELDKVTPEINQLTDEALSWMKISLPSDLAKKIAAGDHELMTIYCWASFANISSNHLADFLKRFKVAFNNDALQPDDQYLFNLIHGKELPELQKIVSSIAPSLNINSFIPAPPKESPKSSGEEVTIWMNKWLGFGWVWSAGKWIWNADKAPNISRKICEAVKSSLTSDYNLYFGPEIIGKANQGLQKVLESISAPLMVFKNEIGNIPRLSLKDFSNSKVMSSIISTSENLKKALSFKFEEWQLLFNKFGLSYLKERLDLLASKIRTLGTFVAERAFSEKDKYIFISNKGQSNFVLQKIKEIVDKLSTFVKTTYKPGTKEYASGAKQVNQFVEIYNSFNENKNKSWAEIESVLSDKVPAKSFEEFEKNINYYYDQAANLKKASADSLLVKEAQQDGPLAPMPSGDAKPAATSKPSSGGKKISDSEKSAVQDMQLALFRLAGYVQQHKDKFPSTSDGAVSTLLSVGKGEKKADMDGAWGPNTSNALKKAQALFDEWNKLNGNRFSQKLDTEQKMYGDSVAVTAANKNIEVVRDFIAQVFGADLDPNNPSKQVRAFDKLPEGFAQEYSFDQSDPNQGTVPITASNLSSLGRFYKLLTDNGAQVQEVGSDDPRQLPTRGLTVAQFNFYLNTFFKRAKYLWGLPKQTENGRKSAQAYHAAINRLNQALIEMRKRAVTSGHPLKDGDLIPENQLTVSFEGNEFGQPGKGQGPGMGSGGAYQEAVPGQGRGTGEMDGSDSNVPGNLKEPPILQNGTINLSSRYFRQVATKYGKMRYMNKAMFLSDNVANVAQRLFPQGISSQYATEMAIQRAQLQPTEVPGMYWRYNQYAPGGKEVGPVEKFPEFVKAFRLAQIIGPIEKFKEMIVDIRNELPQAINRWFTENPKKASPQEVASMDDEHRQWLDIFNNLEEDAMNMRR